MLTESSSEQPWKKSEEELDAETRTKLQEIKLADVTGEWVSDAGGTRFLHLRLPYHASMVGSLHESGARTGEMTVAWIGVDRKLRGHGIGKRLMQSFAVEARKAGAQVLSGTVISEAAVHNRLQTFGEDNVAFFETRVKDEELEVPLTRDQVILSMRRSRENLDERPGNGMSIGMKVDLTKIDMDGWEQPQVQA